MADIKIQRGIPLQIPQNNPEVKLREASKMYEQYFLNEMVKSMRKTIDHSHLTQQSMAEKIYSEQLDGQYVESWAESGGVGLADIIFNQLQERFFNRGHAPSPKGPIQIQKGTTIKIDESQSHGLPIDKHKNSLPKNEVSFLYQWNESNKSKATDVLSPFSGDVLQNYDMGEDRNVVKLAHADGLVSTISYIGMGENLKVGDQVKAGQKLGVLSPDAIGLTWHVIRPGS